MCHIWNQTLSVKLQLLWFWEGKRNTWKNLHVDIIDMIWYNMMWYDVMWCDIWYAIWWYDMIWYMIWYDTIWYDMIYDLIWYMKLYIWYDMMWCDIIWYDMIIDYHINFRSQKWKYKLLRKNIYILHTIPFAFLEHSSRNATRNCLQTYISHRELCSADCIC